MDVEKSLHDMIADKRAARPPRSRQNDGQGRDRAPRQAPARRDAPYERPPPRSTEDKWVHDAYNGPGARRAPGGFGQGGAGRAYGANVPFTGVSPKIEVQNIHYEVTPADLKGIFSQAGSLVQGPTIRYDRSGRSTGIATMEYSNPQEAKIAINKFDGAMTKGQTISIRLLPPSMPRGPPAGAVAANQGAAGGASLLSRMGGGSLASRVGPAPAQARGSARDEAPRGARPASRARGPSGPRGRGERAPRKAPATADDLDKALENFMKPTDKEGDVNMA